MIMRSLGKTERHFGCNSNDQNEQAREMLSDWGDLLFWKKIAQGKRQHSCLIFEVVPLVGQGSISIFFRKERVLEKDILVVLRRLPALGKLSSILMVRVSFSFRETDI